MTSAVRLCLLCVALVAGFDSAQAADLIAETPAVYDWSGFYLGVNAGYAFSGKSDLTISDVDGKSPRSLRSEAPAKHFVSAAFDPPP